MPSVVALPEQASLPPRWRHHWAGRRSAVAVAVALAGLTPLRRPTLLAALAADLESTLLAVVGL
jgi:hypothetical protein